MSRDSTNLAEAGGSGCLLCVAQKTQVGACVMVLYLCKPSNKCGSTSSRRRWDAGVGSRIADGGISYCLPHVSSDLAVKMPLGQAAAVGVVEEFLVLGGRSCNKLWGYLFG